MDSVNDIHSTPSGPLFSLYREDPEISAIVEGFVKRLPKRLKAMQDALNEANWTDLLTTAHQLKGAAGGYGYPSLTKLAVEIEEGARANDIESVARLLNELEVACQRAELGLSQDV